MIKKFKVLEHTADLRIKAFGKTKRKLFSNMLQGMAENQKPEIKKKEKVKKRIKIESPDPNSLLVDFLSEVLYLSQVDAAVYNRVKFNKFTDTEIKGKLIGNKVEKFGEDIKGVTYHNLNIIQKKDGNWQVTVIFDI